ncbi:MAG: DUF3325 domain-containing protein [Burkholderiales bacterium]|jgi:hypothetical protein|nr:DUF3325 domain-containing protein [Burkholderiales bacterium]
MMEILPDFLILMLMFIGLGAICVGMNRHARQVFGILPSLGMRCLRIALGFVALMVSLVPAIDDYGTSIGVAVWIGYLAVIATMIGLVLTYYPRILRPAFPMALAGLLIAVLVSW